MQQQQPPLSIKVMLCRVPGGWAMGRLPRGSQQSSASPRELQVPTHQPGDPMGAVLVPALSLLCRANLSLALHVPSTGGTANKEQAFDAAKFSICSRDF